ncbi:hypothetical protein [Marinicrinis lubricantis]|uniref:Uncharacterized protein n=1 Tax=Marinicrinis lubricantis TaxID=2086470 RepID=A0ABW1IHM7_9BACL
MTNAVYSLMFNMWSADKSRFKYERVYLTNVGIGDIVWKEWSK